MSDKPWRPDYPKAAYEICKAMRCQAIEITPEQATAWHAYDCEEREGSMKRTLSLEEFACLAWDSPKWCAQSLARWKRNGGETDHELAEAC